MKLSTESDTWIHIAAMLSILFVVFDRAYMAFISQKISPTRWRTWVLVVATVGALWIAFRKSTYLPFLGEAAIPHTTFLVSSPDYADSSATVVVDPRATRVVYWSASNAPGSVAATPKDAYGKFENVGTAMVVEGKATLRFRKSGSYKTPMGRVIGPHVHYRTLFPDGMAGDVKTMLV